MSNVVYTARKIAALALICVLSVAGGLALVVELGCFHDFSYVVNGVAVGVTILGLLALGFYGLLRGRSWARWPALGGGLFLLWFFGSQLFVRLCWSYGFGWPWLHLTLISALLVLALVGPTMARRHDAQLLPQGVDRLGRVRLFLVRWALVVSFASLPMFINSATMPNAALYSTFGSFHLPAMAILIGALVLGMVMIIRQRTFGLFLLAATGTAAAWLFGPVVQWGVINWFEVACRAGHTFVYFIPLLFLAPPMWRKLRFG